MAHRIRHAYGLVVLCSLLIACGGGGSSAPPQSTSITGSVSGTVVLAVDEIGNIAARDDTAGRTPIDNTVPPKYQFTLNVSQGHQYHLFFIVDEGTPSERIVPLYFGTTNVFSVGTASSIDLGFVDTSSGQATAQNSPFSVPGVTPGPETGPSTIRIEGYKFFILLDNFDNAKRYRVDVQVKDAAGTTLTNGSLVKVIKVYSPTGAELPPDGNFYCWNGTEYNVDVGGGIVPTPLSEVIVYLAAAPGSLPGGFYTVVVTDNNGNLYTSTLYHETPTEVSKPTGLSQTVNTDNSITLTWTNPAGISSPAYSVWAYVLSDDEDGDGFQEIPLRVSGSASMNSYTIPAGFVQSALSGRTGLKWMVQIRQQTTAPVIFPDGTSSFPQFYWVRSAQATLTLPAPSAGFSQADLTGTWDIHQFQSSTVAGESGWARFIVTFDGSGAVTIVSYDDSWGTVIPPGPTPYVWTMNSSGMVTETDSGNPTDTHLNMASNKQMIVGTGTAGTGTTSMQMFIARKRVPGVTFGSADLFNRSFAFHELGAGNRPKWERGDGTIDSTGSVDLLNRYDSDGGHFTNLMDVASLSIDADGIVTDSLAPSYKGFLTPDKSVLIMTGTSGDIGTTNYSLLVVTISGPTFTQADLAGVWSFHALGCGSRAYWFYGTISVDGAGTGTYSGVNTSSGPETHSPVSLSINSGGEVLLPGTASFHGTMSSRKNVVCATETNNPGDYHIILAVK